MFKKIIFIILLCFSFVFLPNEIQALNTDFTPSNNSLYKNYEYVMDNYNIDIIVNENNTLNITENIGAYFNVEKHGIYRKIPLRNKIKRLDGTTSKKRSQISNINVNDKYTVSNSDGYKVIKIGNFKDTLTGKKDYTISYLYNLGKDPLKNSDEFYYNIIGNEWDTVIGNITFNIILPKEFDATKLGFSSGPVGSTDSSNITYSVNGNTISGRYNGILNTKEALTVRLELPEDYFVSAGLDVNIKDYIYFIFPIIFLIISICLWYKYGRDRQVIETVEFYPPEGFNSLEVGYLYKGEANSNDVISLLIYLANKGYIKITETEEKSLFSKVNGFKITKLKEYDGNNVNERLFLKGLFSANTIFDDEEKLSNLNEVTSSDLEKTFYVTTEEILSNINTKENKDKLFEKGASSKLVIMILMIIASFCLITIPPVLMFDGIGMILVALLFPGIGFTVMFSLLFGKSQTIYVNGKATNSLLATRIFGLIWGGLFGGVPWAFAVLPALLLDPLYLVGYLVGLLCIFGMIICIKYLPKRTQYGIEILGKLKGFKNFLETVEKDKLETMVLENPTYFYDILPYAYVLGVSDKWIKKFETIMVESPSWYDSSKAFNIATFSSFMNSTMTSAEITMSSSSSSGGSGGGSSGGGSGGGGGGSW